MKPTDKKSWRYKLHEIIYEADTPLGKLFDIVLLVLILVSVIIVMLESVRAIDAQFHKLFYIIEWVITIFFTIEYIARVITVKKPKHYIFSFYGIIDLLSTIPLYLSFILAGSSYFLAVRALRLLRVFRILKITRYVGESNKLAKALKDSRAKILVFLFAVLIIATIAGTMMYLIEGEESGFVSIPVSVYWCIVTLTTVGFGDIAPVTPLGQFLATIIMIMGYGIIAVPTGIVSAEYTKSLDKTDVTSKDYVHVNTQVCRNCGAQRHRDDADFCHKCGSDLHPENNREA
ncbi:Kef-type K+ ransport system, predicted NAD-binding component [Aequorivita sublithincola DSM 14238]|uniref:Kef-type K+ ransport system, predicted NAD-binding component n=1 Tax=Aequorivita sublithincola (strain DSM 14238 / LMG 21431 / ACAM 643 / 9-3) TaxID=746697 RepID=I3Z077_AEQSU|nr:ion transporter [Aequorivita sublithincola]AFL82645.1 Kef-type K+ ransport system, predicted NAD-binding component [Aequorivita sublithincola DSM 14238]